MMWWALAWASIEGPTAVRHGEPVVLRAEAPVRWWRREVAPGDYDNAAHCGAPRPGCAQPLPVRWVAIGRGRSLPLELPVGSHHFATTEGDAPPVATAPEHTVAVRLDDSYVGVLHELIGVPFVFAPAQLEAGHQTDLRLATDCVALVIYGRRRLGQQVPYVSPYKLYEWLQPATGPVRVGDVIHWGWQTAVVAEDLAPVGVLDRSDVLILAWQGEAERRVLGSLPFAGTPSTRLRWAEPDAAARHGQPRGGVPPSTIPGNADM